MSRATTRRDFLTTTAAGAVGATLLPAGMPEQPGTLFAAPSMDRVRVGFVGVGGMGMVHVENLLAIEGVELKAIGDIVPEKVTKAQDLIVAAGQPRPTGYSRGPRDFERMCAEEDLDLVYNATPWEWHVPIMLAAMKHGKHAATEVPAATTVEECWQLVEAAEKYRKHAVMMENCCYDRLELLAFHLARKGLLGELLHGECGYNHDLRAIKFADEGEGLWRRAHSIARNANLYPTHGLGPIAQAMDINRGNQFDYLVSMSGPSRGLQNWAAEHLPADSPKRRERYRLGDVNVSLIRTVKGQTIYLTHDTNLPRPYSRKYLLQGTKGLVEGYPRRVYIEGASEREDRWDAVEQWFASHDHPLWASEGVKQASRGHGGMDFLEDLRLIHCLRRGLPTDQNVYDAAAWSVITSITEQSLTARSKPVSIPDFTRGRWRSTPPLGIIEA
ncbi:MAG: Gfo/Idh/MocA family oxidoreductase [Gemmatimonadetes bacterium]|nr:Gfo/Idh/MocA family oxidoreductase [Gemmatimonadota bacterium]